MSENTGKAQVEKAAVPSLAQRTRRVVIGHDGQMLIVGEPIAGETPRQFKTLSLLNLGPSGLFVASVEIAFEGKRATLIVGMECPPKRNFTLQDESLLDHLTAEAMSVPDAAPNQNPSGVAGEVNAGTVFTFTTRALSQHGQHALPLQIQLETVPTRAGNLIIPA